jgi:hypothetical protein
MKMVIALLGKYRYLISLLHITIVLQEVKDMAKAQDSRKNEKKAPKKTLKEKKQEKRAKKNK